MRTVNFVMLHLGEDVVIPLKDIIAIFDLEVSQVSDINKEFFEITKEEDLIRKVSEDDPKTFLLVNYNNKSMIFLSPISSSTLLKRSGFLQNISDTTSLVEREGYNGKELFGKWK